LHFSDIIVPKRIYAGLCAGKGPAAVGTAEVNGHLVELDYCERKVGSVRPGDSPSCEIDDDANGDRLRLGTGRLGDLAPAHK